MLASCTLLLGFLETIGVKFTLDKGFCLWNCGFLDRGALAWLALNILDHVLEHEAGVTQTNLSSTSSHKDSLPLSNSHLTFAIPGTGVPADGCPIKELCTSLGQVRVQELFSPSWHWK